MPKGNVAENAVEVEWESGLDEIARHGAQKLLQRALEWEVDEFLRRHDGVRNLAGNRQVIRNGRLPEREILTGAGALTVRQPRVRDRRGVADPDAVQFSSKLLLPYLRRSKNVDELIPWLYLRGISQQDMQSALTSLLGEGAAGLSANVVGKLTSDWIDEVKAWSRRSLADEEYVYVWAGGVYFNVRLDEDRQCILVLMGATREGKKELIAIQDGYRESEQSWKELLLDLPCPAVFFGFRASDAGASS